jgi:hypothetical protein
MEATFVAKHLQVFHFVTPEQLLDPKSGGGSGVFGQKNLQK